jgi:hypothetical protein
MLSGGTTIQSLTSMPVTEDTGEKPQSKVWRYDDTWWSVMPNDDGIFLWRLDDTEWDPVLKLSANDSAKADVKPLGDLAHVLLYDDAATELVSLDYSSGIYELWPARPTPTPVVLDNGVETATIDVDSTGRMWLAVERDNNIEVRYSDAPYALWSDPISIATGVDDDDIAAVTALPNGTIGVMWSNQVTQRFGFKFHVDGADPMVWSTDEVPASQSAIDGVGFGFADDHLNFAVASDSTLYAAVKTSYDTPGFTKIALLVRRPSGVWDNAYEVAQNGTRPAVVLNEALGCVYFIYTQNEGGSDIVYKETFVSSIDFSGPELLLIAGADLNDVTSTKQNATNELLVLASTTTTVHGGLMSFAGVADQPPSVYAGHDLSGMGSTTVALDGSAIEGEPNPAGAMTVTWSKVSGPGNVTFGNASARDTSASFDEPGAYVLRLTAIDGGLSASDDVQITIGGASQVSTSFQDGASPTPGYFGTRDTRIRSKKPNANFGTHGLLAADGSPDDAALLKWDLALIPIGSTVQAASITLYVSDFTKHSYEVYELTQEWDEGAATWNSRLPGIGWDAAGAQGAADHAPAPIASATTTSTGLLTIPISNLLVQSWVDDPDSNYGIIFQDYTSATDSLGFSSRENSTTGRRPKLSVTYIGPNEEPTASNDTYMVDEDNTLTVAAPGVLDNDDDPDGDTLSAVLVTGPASGTFDLHTDGSFVYTPPANFNGPVSFTYRASDGALNSNLATVTITVNAMPDPPVAVDDVAGVDEDAAVTFDVRGNDSDIDGDTLSVIAVSDPSSGAATINPDGTITYTPDGDFYGGDSFSYTISDGNGGTATANVAVTVNPVDDPPTANDDSADTLPNVAVSIAVLANDTHADGDSLDVATVSDPAGGAAAIELDGTITYTPDPGFHGADSFTYEAGDSDGDTDSATATVVVNTAPSAAGDSATVNEDTQVIIAVLSNDTDADMDTLSVSSVSDPTNGTATLNPDGTVTYMPDGNFNGSDSFTYEISDGFGGVSSATVDVTVNPVNDEPTANGESAGTNEDTAVTIAVLANDADVDGDTLVVTSVSDPAHGSTVINPDGTITYTPDGNDNGSDSFTYDISDGNGGVDSATVFVTVNAVNDSPTANDDSAETNEDTAVVITVLTNDSDTDGDTLVVASVSDPARGAATINPDGTITYTPDDNLNGLDSFTYVISDGNGGTAAATVNLTVNAVNDAPSFVKGANQTLVLGAGAQTVAGWATNISAGASDESAQMLSFAVSNNNNGLFSTPPAIAADGTLTYTPAPGVSGSATVTVSLADDGGTGGGGADTSAPQSFTITVDAAGTTVSFQDGVGGYTGTRDATIKATNAVGNFGLQANLTLYGAGSSDEASLVKWDVSSIATNATVHSASITFYFLNGAVAPEVYEVYEVLRPWVESEVTWNRPAVGATWGTNGAQAASDHGSEVLGTVEGATGAFLTINLGPSGIAMVQRWVNTPGANNGIIIQDYSATDWTSVASSEYSSATKRPKLTVTYSSP